MLSRLNNPWLVSLVFGLVSQTSAQTFTTLHSFSGSDGSSPTAGLVISGGVFYGTANEAGISGWGTIYRINADGSGFAKLHDFMWNGTNTEGALPNATLIAGKGTLYGTTERGGLSDNGTVFGINTDGSGFTNLHAFTGTDGVFPCGRLVLSGQTLYGTTFGRLAGDSKGTVFAINTDGSGFTNLHTFGGIGDGANPGGGLVLSGNILYGTTQGGGTSGNGTVFAVNTDSTGYKTLHSFSPSVPACCWVDWFTNSDGALIMGGLVVSGNTLYGTAYNCGLYGYGTVFKLETDGTGFAILHSFNVTDGANPAAGLVLSGNTLYGTTCVGGSNGEGTAFGLNVDGTGFTRLYSFESADPEEYLNSSGSNPLAELTLSGAVLYGTAQAGGGHGFGTLFSISMAPALWVSRSESNLILAWPTSLTGFDYSGYTLQSTTNLALPVWTTSLVPSVVINGEKFATNPISGVQRFFRLSQ